MKSPAKPSPSSHSRLQQAKQEVARLSQAYDRLASELAAMRARAVAAEERLRQAHMSPVLDSDAQFARVFDQAPAVMAIQHGPDHRFTFANRLTRQLFPGRELIGRPVREALPELAGQGVIELMDRVYQRGETVSMSEFPVWLDREGDGSRQLTYFNFVYQPTYDEVGRVNGLLTHAVEVTDQVRARQALGDDKARVEAVVEERTRALHAAGETLARQKNLLARIIDHVPAGIAYINRDLVYEWVNPAHARDLGMSVAAMVGRQVYDLFGAALEAQLGVFFRRALDGEAQFGREIPLRWEVNGTERLSYWDFSFQPVRGDTGEVEGFLTLAQEVSERMEGQRLQQERIAQAEEADRLKKSFLNMTSHELRTPLSAIVGYAEFLEDGIGGELNATQCAFVTHIQEGSRRLQRLVDDILDFARIEAGTFDLDVSPDDLVALVRREVSNLGPQAAEAGVSLRAELPDGPIEVHVDDRRISQVVLNLVGNAIKFTPKGGRVTVALSPSPGSVLVSVRDTGRGLSPHHLPRVFDKFFQVDTSTTREHGGAGLGLSISKAIVEAHGGVLGVSSPGEGRGCTFWFTLPSAGGQEGDA